MISFPSSILTTPQGDSISEFVKGALNPTVHVTSKGSELALSPASQTISLYSSQTTYLHFQPLKAAALCSEFAQQFIMHTWGPPGILA